MLLGDVDERAQLQGGRAERPCLVFLIIKHMNWQRAKGRANLKHFAVPTSITNHRTKKISFFLSSSKNMIKSGLFRQASVRCLSMEETEAQ